MRLGQHELAERFPKTSVVKGCNATLRRILLKHPDAFLRQGNTVQLHAGYDPLSHKGAEVPVGRSTPPPTTMGATTDPAIIAKIVPKGTLSPRPTRPQGKASATDHASGGVGGGDVGGDGVGGGGGGGGGGAKPRMIKPKAIPGLPSNRKPSITHTSLPGDGDASSNLPPAAPRRRRQNAKRLKREAKELGITPEELKAREVR